MNNFQAIGYAILALKKLGAGEEFIERFEAEMKYQMDTNSEEFAEKTYKET